MPAVAIAKEGRSGGVKECFACRSYSEGREELGGGFCQVIPFENLALSFLPVLIVIVIFYRWSIGGGMSIYAMARMLIQLLLIGYVLAFIFLGLHLHHGFQSAFQSLGVNHPKYTPFIKKLALAFTIVVPAGFALISLYFFFN